VEFIYGTHSSYWTNESSQVFRRQKQDKLNNFPGSFLQVIKAQLKSNKKKWEKFWCLKFKQWQATENLFSCTTSIVVAKGNKENWTNNSRERKLKKSRAFRLQFAMVRFTKLHITGKAYKQQRQRLRTVQRPLKWSAESLG
jgi:hypothetical protein